MPTTITNTIGTGGAYSTPQAWEDAAPADLVTVDQIWRGELKNEDFTAADRVLIISGSTTDATRYKHLTCEAAASWKDNIGASPFRYNSSYGATLRKTGSYGVEAVTLNEAYSRIIGVQMYAPYFAASGSSTALYHRVVNSRVEDCIIEGNAANVIFTRGGTLVNSLVIQARAGRDSIIASSNSTQYKVYNCTLAAYSDNANAAYGFKKSYNNFTVQNTSIFGINIDLGGSGGSQTVTTCATDDATPTSGFTGSLVYADQFINTTVAGADFRVKAAASLIDAGTTDAVNAPNDAFGTARPIGAAYDIAAHEYGAVGPDTTPDPPIFTDQIDVAVNDVILSNTEIITGIDASTPISVVTGEYSINGGTFTTSAGTVVVNDTVQLRQTSSASNSTLTNTVLDIGGVVVNWNVTTVAASAGTITTQALKNNTGTLLINETSVIVDIYNVSTGALVLHSAIETTNASGILTITDASLVATTAYTVVIRLSTNALGVDEITAT